jgi:hypothetical protein
MKPPVVVIGRHCKTNQCWIAVRFKKTQSVANISQSHAQERADDDAPIRQASSTDGVAEKQNFIFVMDARAILESSHSRPRRRFYSGDG